MEPFTMALAGGSALTSLVGGFIGAAGASAAAGYQARAAQFRAQAESDALRYNADVDEYNANIAIRDRTAVIEQAAAAGRDIRVKSRAEQGQIRAAYGWSGLALEGSPLDVLEATALEQSLDFRKVLYAGDVQAAGLTDRANILRSHASMLRVQASNAQVAGNLQAAAAYSGAAYSSAASILQGIAGAASAGRAFIK